MIPGGIELGIVVLLVLLLFGSTIIPKLARRTGTVAERLRHVDEDVQEGRQEVTHER